jgi:HEPN domain-containing protein
MPLDPEFVAETQAWLIKARRDLRAAEVLDKAEAGLAGDALYHCQQAAEKALKGFLAWHGRTFRKTHNIVELGQQVVEIAPGLATVVRESARLTDYAWKFRYPGEESEPQPGETAAALQLARRLYETVAKELPEEVQP